MIAGVFRRNCKTILIDVSCSSYLYHRNTRGIISFPEDQINSVPAEFEFTLFQYLSHDPWIQVYATLITACESYQMDNVTTSLIIPNFRWEVSMAVRSAMRVILIHWETAYGTSWNCRSACCGLSNSSQWCSQSLEMKSCCGIIIIIVIIHETPVIIPLQTDSMCSPSTTLLLCTSSPASYTSLQASCVSSHISALLFKRPLKKREIQSEISVSPW